MMTNSKVQLDLEIEYATRTPIPYVLLKGVFQHTEDPENRKWPIHIGVTLTPSGRAPYISGVLCEGMVEEREGDTCSNTCKKSWQARLCVERDTMKELLANPRSGALGGVVLSWKPADPSVCHSHPTFFGKDPQVQVERNRQDCR